MIWGGPALTLLSVYMSLALQISTGCEELEKENLMDNIISLAFLFAMIGAGRVCRHDLQRADRAEERHRQGLGEY